MDIENYAGRTPAVIAIAGHRVTAWIGDEKPAVGSALGVGDVVGRITSVAARHTVEAVVFDPSRLAVGDAAHPTGEPLTWPPPIAGVHRLTELSWATGRAPGAPPSRAADPQVVATGVEVVDTKLSLVRGGVNLLVDPAEHAELFARFVGWLRTGPVVALDCDLPIEDVYAVLADGSRTELATDVAVQWANALDDALLVIEARDEVDLDRLTKDLGDRTVLVWWVVPPGLDLIAETLDVGMADTQIVLRDDGTIDFSRSHSRQATDTDWARTVGAAAELRDQVAIVGDDDLEPEQRELLDSVAAAEHALLDI